MSEPTYKQHKILENIDTNGCVYATGEEDNIELYWELVRSGYLKNLAIVGGIADWKFILAEKGEAYLQSIKEPTDE